MTWREQIKAIGGNKIARGMGVKYPTVYRYIKPGSKTLPRTLTKKLCKAVEPHLTRREYKDFLNSLSNDVTREIAA